MSGLKYKCVMFNYEESNLASLIIAHIEQTNTRVVVYVALSLDSDINTAHCELKNCAIKQLNLANQ